MENIINMIKDKYLIGSQDIEVLGSGRILFVEDDGKEVIQSKKEFINDYIDFLTDLLKQNREEKEHSNCVFILEDLIMLYRGLEILDLINK